MINNETDKKQLKLKKFCETFDIPRSTALRWIHAKDFPSYNLTGHWYVDVEKFYNWREHIHQESYKYA